MKALKNTRKTLLAATALTGLALTWGPLAHADLISIGLQESGVNGGNITTETTGSKSAGIIGTTYGVFTLNNVSAADTAGLGLPELLYSNSINSTSSGSGTLYVFITAQGLTQPSNSAGFVLHSYTSNSLTSGWSVTEKTFYSSSNALYAGSLTGSATFTSLGTHTNSSPVNFSNLFSVTQEYIITAIGHGTANDTIDTSVPEPGSLGIFGTGLVGLGLIGLLRRRRNNGRKA